MYVYIYIFLLLVQLVGLKKRGFCTVGSTKISTTHTQKKRILVTFFSICLQQVFLLSLFKISISIEIDIELLFFLGGGGVFFSLD